KSTKSAGAPAKKPVKSLFDENVKQDELTQFVNDIRERPLLYVGIVAFLLACLVAGFLYKAYSVSSRQALMTAYARALDKTEPAESFTALQPLAEGRANGTDEVLYVAAETAYDAGEYDKAKEAFQQLRERFPDSPYVPDAVEGLGNIAENASDFDGAVALYNEVKDKWPESFAARRQALNIAKLEERRGKLEASVAAYQEQLQAFAGSTVAQEADAALARLRNSNPELFPTPEPAAATTALPGLPTDPAAPATAPAAGAEAVVMPDLNLQLQTPDVTAADPAAAAPGAIAPEAAAPVEEATPAPAAEAAPAAEPTPEATAPAAP
ncbi:MAG TPA: tetratricopeptide repeat protein, partial [Candidatus Hydrogenedentes bacterium]|nr:tetratricopeptide repeat protein [Candidatus Hydrogenedentota bacterium]